MGTILNADQMKRYGQLRLQRVGLSMALAEKEVVDELKLTADQQTKVRFYVDPLAVLPKLPQTSVTLGGFTSTSALEVTFNTTDPDHPPGVD